MDDVTVSTDGDGAQCPPMSELQRIARDSYRTAVLLCDAAGLALVPGPTEVTVYVRQRSRPSNWSRVETIDLPQIAPATTGRHANRRPRT